MTDKKHLTDRQSWEGKHHSTARAFMEYLPGVWRYSDEESKAAYAILRNQDGSGMRIRLMKGKLRITGMWPAPIPGPHHVHLFEPDRFGKTNPAINCSPDRKPEHLARDIAVRFLQPYAPLWLLMLDKRAERIAEDKLEAAVIQRLIAAGATHETGGGYSNRIYFRYTGDSPHGHADVSVKGEQVRVSLNIGGIPLEVAEVIIAELADCRQAIRLAKMQTPPDPDSQLLRHLDGRPVTA